MNKHERINRLLVDFALGELSQQQQVDVKTHLARCPQCKSELKKLEALLECTGQIRELSVDTRMCESAKQAVFEAVESKETKPTPRPNVSLELIWRTIMKSPITKLAAVAVIFIAVVFITRDSNLSSPAYGITDVPEILRQTRTIHIKGWQCAHLQPGLLHDPNIVQPGQKETRGLLEYWLDMETGAMKSTQPGSVVIKGNEVIAAVYAKIYDGEFIMTVNDERKEVWFDKLTPYRQLLRKRKNLLAVLQNMLPSLDSSDAFKKTAQEEIDGQIFDVWEAELNPPSWGGNRSRYKAWVSPANGHLGRMELWSGKRDMNWYQFAEISQIEYNVNMPSGIFATEAPPGYTSRNTKETARVPRLFQNRNRIGDQTIASYACFTLNDGSVIIGWSCTTGWPENEWESDSYQEAIFEDLVPGGELPKLPVEFHTVSPIDENPGVKYHGRHLAYTRKENIFHEWGLYVPEKKLDKYYGRLGYNLFYRCNSKDVNREGAFTLGETGDIQIETKTDFNLFVLGVMAELSDDRTVPANVGYEEALQLIDQVRDSLNN